MIRNPTVRRLRSVSCGRRSTRKRGSSPLSVGVKANANGGYSSRMKSAYVNTRTSYRRYIAWILAKPSGRSPVKRMTNQEMMPTTSARIRNPYRITKCGMANSQLRSGRQLATFSGGSKVSVAG